MINYPYVPSGKTFLYVPHDNEFMIAAKQYAHDHSLDTMMPTASVVVKSGIILGKGANGSDYHKTHICQRVRQHIPTGQGYELCEGCHPKNHSELRAIADAIAKGHDVQGSSLYLWGHWWCCQPCWTEIIRHGIKEVFLIEKSEELFNKEHPDNIVGKQFE